MEDVAIVGIGLRFPGNASSPEELWKVLERGESQWTEFPKDRLNIDGYYHPGGDRQGSVGSIVVFGACLRDSLTRNRYPFEEHTSSKVMLPPLMLRYVPSQHWSYKETRLIIICVKFFSVSGEDAKAIDPQQRMLLETTFEALENGNEMLYPALEAQINHNHSWHSKRRHRWE